MPDAPAAPQLPHGIMGLQPEAFPWMPVMLGSLACLALALIGWFLWTRLRRRSSHRPVTPVTRPVDPWLRVEQRLQTLDIQEPWSREVCEDFFFQLSFVLREALELRTGLPITGQTLAETRTSLEKSPALSANFQQDLIKFLSLSEQLKFAGQWLGAAESLEWREKVKAWVEQLRRGEQS
ncbi:MAG: hypothetical protein M3Q07_07755 [Pseudobdellovibrionaceae bacterium]|nr:hypothetical protein [Pseudobdellovibrionaceae bacterium]